MKHLFVWVGLVLISGFACAQTDQLNQQKYWKFRDQLREDFVKISDVPGGSIVARAVKPNSCYNNIADDSGFGGNNLGEMHFGDGMIRHGYYLGLLATEYRLLKDAGQDVTGVLTELYYALVAINRLDYQAEIEQSQCYEFQQDGGLNGFYMREDIPENFAETNWSNTDMRMYCVNSAHFKSNNALNINSGSLKTEPNSYQNVPSMDQLSSLMLGFRLIKELVDEPDGAYVVAEMQAIVNRIMTYLNEHNWMMIDVNGWPVNNGGGDCFWAAYPLFSAAYHLTNNLYNTDWTRRVEAFTLRNVQFCITGFGVDSVDPIKRDSSCVAAVQYDELAYNQLIEGGDPGEDNNQNHSVYQDWLAGGILHGSTNALFFFWNEPINTMDDFLNGNNVSLNVPGTALSFINAFTDNSGHDDWNFGILASNLAVASGIWSSNTINHITQQTGNVELDLMNSIIRNEPPTGSQSYYQNYLNSMPMSGPYYFHESTGETGTNITRGAANGWASEHRWTWGEQAYGGGQNTGIFNGLDYLLYHNLYRIVYPDNLDEFTPESSEECYCGSTPVATVAVDQTNPAYNIHLQLTQYLNDKLAYVPVCTENNFKKVNNHVFGTYNIAPYFPEYTDMNIFTNEFETENAWFESGSDVSVNTPFIVCNNSTLTMKPGSVLTLRKKHMRVNAGSTFDVSGDVYVHGGTKLIIKSGANLILRPGSKLILHEDCSVEIEPGATLTYYNGATIYTKNETGYLIIKGNLDLEDNATFSIDHSFSTISGCVIFEGEPMIHAKPGSKVFLTSKGKNDPIVAVRNNTVVKFDDPDLVSVRFQNCGVTFETGSIMRFQRPVTTSNMKFSGTATHAGQLYVTNDNSFQTSDFADMHLTGELGLTNSYILEVQQCNFTQTNPALQNGSGILVNGRGYRINFTNFTIHASGMAMVESQKLTVTSLISNCTFNSTTAALGDQAIYDASNVEVRVNQCNFIHLKEAITKVTGKLTVRCSQFTNSYNRNITVVGGLLNMSTGARGGYNTFNPLTGTATDRSHILLVKATIDMHAGSNYLKDVPIAGGLVRGTLLTSCSSASNCSLDFSGNQWGSLGFTSPNANRFSIKSSNNITVSVNTLLPQFQAQCGALDQTTPVIDILSITGSSGLSQIPVYYSALMNAYLRLDVGIILATTKMTDFYPSTGNDLEAIRYFNEIFTSNITIEGANAPTKQLLAIAQRNMKLALETAMANNAVTVDQNNISFESHTAMYVNSLNKLTAVNITTDNYGMQFHNEFDKAQVLRAVGQPQKSLELLQQLEECGLDLFEQQLVNREKKYAMTDALTETYGAAILDTVIVPDTLNFIVPENYSGGYNFGSTIYNINYIDYVSCYGARSTSVFENHQLNLFPNPSSDVITIVLPDEWTEGEVQFEFYQADGRLVQKQLAVTSEHQLIMKLENWSPGTYRYSCVGPDGIQYSGVFTKL